MLKNVNYNLLEEITELSQALYRYDTYVKDAEAAGCAECAGLWRELRERHENTTSVVCSSTSSCTSTRGSSSSEPASANQPANAAVRVGGRGQRLCGRARPLTRMESGDEKRWPSSCGILMTTAAPAPRPSAMAGRQAASPGEHDELRAA